MIRRIGKNKENRTWFYIILIVLVLVIVILSLILGIILGRYSASRKTPVINDTVIRRKISMCSDLTTSTLDYHGAVRFEEGDIPWINQKIFTMEYDAHVEAGIDLSKTELEIRDNVIYITIPEVEIQNVVIDPNSLEFHDETFSLFNWKEHEDVAEALQYAQEDADVHIDETRLTEQARQQAEEVIRTLLAPIVEDEQNSYEIVIQ